jgi:hypothetical protein
MRTATWSGALLAACAGGCTLLLFLVDPAASRVFPPCPLHVITGLYCPGCGSLRALHQLLHGNIAGALALNPLMVLSLPVLALLVFRRSWSYKAYLPWCVLLILVSYGVLRNVPLWPFVLLRPH